MEESDYNLNLATKLFEKIDEKKWLILKNVAWKNEYIFPQENFSRSEKYLGYLFLISY